MCGQGTGVAGQSSRRWVAISHRGSTAPQPLALLLPSSSHTLPPAPPPWRPPHTTSADRHASRWRAMSRRSTKFCFRPAALEEEPLNPPRDDDDLLSSSRCLASPPPPPPPPLPSLLPQGRQSRMAPSSSSPPPPSSSSLMHPKPTVQGRAVRGHSSITCLRISPRATRAPQPLEQSTGSSEHTAQPVSRSSVSTSRGVGWLTSVLMTSQSAPGIMEASVCSASARNGMDCEQCGHCTMRHSHCST